ncbi:hypothetical protein [Dubosiella newyorkensis]|uniref:hypothetical protein n=1 Tax=Dubosiella newyorkensis TaxID=1862672 RepID=UPI003F667E1F
MRSTPLYPISKEPEWKEAKKDKRHSDYIRRDSTIRHPDPISIADTIPDGDEKKLQYIEKDAFRKNEKPGIVTWGSTKKAWAFQPQQELEFEKQKKWVLR